MPAIDQLRADARDNRARLLGTAQTVFAEQGVDASLRDVARRAGVGIGTLYRHFPNRDALLQALFGEALDNLATHADELLAGPDPGAALVVWLERFATGSTRYRGLPSSVLAAVQDEGSDLHGACKRMNAAGAALLDRAQRAGEIRADVTINDLCTLVAGIALACEHMPSQPDLKSRLIALCAGGFVTAGE